MRRGVGPVGPVLHRTKQCYERIWPVYRGLDGLRWGRLFHKRYGAAGAVLHHASTHQAARRGSADRVRLPVVLLHPGLLRAGPSDTALRMLQEVSQNLKTSCQRILIALASCRRRGFPVSLQLHLLRVHCLQRARERLGSARQGPAVRWMYHPHDPAHLVLLQRDADGPADHGISAVLGRRRLRELL